MDQTVTAAKPALYQPSEAAIAHLCGAVQCATVSAEDDAQVNWQEFEKLHAFLETSYPLIHKTMEREVVARGSLLYRWKGRGKGKFVRRFVPTMRRASKGDVKGDSWPA